MHLLTRYVKLRPITHLQYAVHIGLYCFILQLKCTLALNVSGNKGSPIPLILLCTHLTSHTRSKQNCTHHVSINNAFPLYMY